MGRLHGTKDMWLASLREDGVTFAAAVAEAGFDSPVPSCPGWTVGHLVHHLGSGYRFTRTHVVRGTTARPERSQVEFESEPYADDLLDWWEREFVQLIATFDGLDPGLDAWNWAPQSKKVGFWQRRMAHETAVHRWDAQMAAGHAEPIETKLAADGVAEVLDTWLPAGRRLFPAEEWFARGTVALHATDIEHVWHVRLRGEGIALLDTDTIFGHDEPHARVTVNGSSSDLELALYGRVGFDALDVSGDEALLQTLRVG